MNKRGLSPYMKKRLTPILLLLLLVNGTVVAQLPSNASQRAFLDYTHSLYVEGNRCYVETGNKTHLKHLWNYTIMKILDYLDVIPDVKILFLT